MSDFHRAAFASRLNSGLSFGLIDNDSPIDWWTGIISLPEFLVKCAEGRTIDEVYRRFMKVQAVCAVLHAELGEPDLREEPYLIFMPAISTEGGFEGYDAEPEILSVMFKEENNGTGHVFINLSMMAELNKMLGLTTHQEAIVCPHHAEKTGALIANFSTGTFHCLECGERGNLQKMQLAKVGARPTTTMTWTQIVRDSGLGSGQINQGRENNEERR